MKTALIITLLTVSIIPAFKFFLKNIRCVNNSEKNVFGFVFGSCSWRVFYSVSLGSFRGITNLFKCLSKDIMACVFVAMAAAYWMASSMSSLWLIASSTALISSVMVVL